LPLLAGSFQPPTADIVQCGNGNDKALPVNDLVDQPKSLAHKLLILLAL
jgi:hypothetical protein